MCALLIPVKTFVSVQTRDNKINRITKESVVKVIVSPNENVLKQVFDDVKK